MEKEELVAWLGKTKTAAHRTVAAHLKTFPSDMRFTDKGLNSLIQFHPNKKFPNAVTFVLATTPPYHTKALFVEARTGGLIDCSWIKCIANLYGKFDSDKNKRTKGVNALRNEAYQSAGMQAAHELYANGGKCAVCEQDHKKLDVDHDGKPFAQIADEFLAANSLTLTTLKVKYCDHAFRLQGRKLRKEWQAYHDAQAVLKGVCHSCNCSKGSGGYRHVKPE
jgi:hypothetical protein